MPRKSKIPLRFKVTDDRDKASAWVRAAANKYGEEFVLLHTYRVGVNGIYTIQPRGRWDFSRPGVRTVQGERPRRCFWGGGVLSGSR